MILTFLPQNPHLSYFLHFPSVYKEQCAGTLRVTAWPEKCGHTDQWKERQVYRCWEDNWTKELLKDSCICNDKAKISPYTQIKSTCTMLCKWKTNQWETRWLIWQSPSVKQASERKDLAEIWHCIVIIYLPPSMHNVKVKSVQFENLSSSLTIS